MQSGIEAKLLEFHSKHILPFGSFPPNERPELSLIIGRQCGDRHYLWTTDEATVQACFPCGAVGVGAAYASILMKQLYYPMSARRAGILAAYIVFKVTSLIEGCGKETKITILRDGQAKPVHPSSIEKMERLFKRWDDAQGELFQYLISNDSVDSSYKAASSTMKAIRKEFTALLK